MFGLSAIANLSSITKTPAKLVEYVHAAAPLRSNATKTKVGTRTRKVGARCAP